MDRAGGSDIVTADDSGLATGKTPAFTIRMDRASYQDLRAQRDNNDLVLGMRDRDARLTIPDFFTEGSNYGGLTEITVYDQLHLDGTSYEIPYAHVLAPDLASTAVPFTSAPRSLDGTAGSDMLV